MKIAIAGDIHLGKKQYNSDRRLMDFRDAWFWLTREVARVQPDVFIITGDLFDKKNVSPVVLSEAMAGLDNAYLGVRLAIEGNHDGRTFVNRGRSWIEFLEDTGYIDGVLRYGQPYVAGAGGLFIAGFEWAGRRTNTAFGNALLEVDALSKMEDYRVIVAHGFPRDFSPGAGGIDHELLYSDAVNLIALGHYHRPFNIENRILNPGSMEMTDLSVTEPGGFFVVDVTTGEVNFNKYENGRKIVELEVYGIEDLEKVIKCGDAVDSIFHAKLSGKMDAFAARSLRAIINANEMGAAVVRISDETIKSNGGNPIVVGTKDSVAREIISPLLSDDLTFEQFSEVLEIYASGGNLANVRLVLQGGDDDNS